MHNVSILEDIQIALNAAKNSLERGDYSNALFNIDHADIDLARLRIRLVDIIHDGGSA